MATEPAPPRPEPVHVRRTPLPSPSFREPRRMRRLGGWLRVAVTDLRGDVRRFAVLLACLALGVATIAIVGSVGAALQSALTRDARVVLGGDLEARLSWRAAEPEERALFTSLGTLAEVVEVSG